jgi:predicted nucleic acid-binding Zn ribbon protein
MNNQKCINCGKTIINKRSDANYCSARCRQAAYRNRKYDGQFFAAAKMIALGRVLSLPDVEIAGNKERDSTLALKEFSGEATRFNRLVSQLIFFTRLSETIKKLYNFFDRGQIEKSEFDELNPHCQRILDDAEINQGKISPEIVEFLTELHKLMDVLAMKFEISGKNAHELNIEEPVYAKMLQAYPIIARKLDSYYPDT